MLDLDLNDPVNQVRALIGDLDGSFISDVNITYLLNKNGNDVVKAALESLEYILAQVSYYVREESGDVEVYWHDLYNRIADRKKDLERDTVYSRAASLFKFGGTSRSEVKRVKNDPESRCVGLSSSEFSTVMQRYGIDPDNPYYLECK